ncbi:DUF5655 domain-containing protein [Ideonella sp. A 288]|uniref:DUF5655 domain-containing protein n=1 Tax=Ideonella sp. A 288 TaxID=1962181 RepID=UPI000B4A70A2|nr:DUF5655 domain-containing protein [Ideonella sp. A 288]
MADPHAALLTQLKNIQAKTGRTIAELHAAVHATGLVRHGERRSWLMAHLKLGHGDANTVVHFMDKPLPDLGDGAAAGATPAAAAPAAGDPLDTLYTGSKAHLRPLHEAVMAVVQGFGDFELAPKKSYVSLRRRKQFLTIGPATRDAVEIGLAIKTLPPHPRLKAMPPDSMCAVTTRIGHADEVDAALGAWMRAAYDAAG